MGEVMQVANVLATAADLENGETSNQLATVQGVTVVRKKELSQGLCILTVAKPSNTFLTIVVKQENLPHASVKSITREAGVGAEITATGYIEKSPRGVPGVLCTQPLIVTTGSTSTRTGQGHVTTLERSECRLGVDCPHQESCPFTHSKSPPPKGVSKKTRFDAVCSFILKKLPVTDLEKGSVLDIAGGKGYLSLCLASAAPSLECIIVDPANNARGAAHRSKVREAGVSRMAASGALPEDLLASCSCLVGIHPDEATDDVVLYALRHKKPFFVVPCCVFPTKFTHRKLADGSPVLTRPDLLLYLTERCHEAHRQATVERLGFQGADEILYSLA
eukprot:TRINITY_DN12111_c0_g1_i1.p1 TRINITY_DN12111_c0_g1~~TRINITY_DN12111_c0_g1_i1.p1  ORF type:complete len:334 (+),score=66.75 TRINITY_DN12111_c0_g1_i1:407-1408(+)